jgi:glutamyl-tRNA reductase
VYLYTIDDLNAVACATVRNREQDLALCNQIIESGAGALMEKVSARKERLFDNELQFQASWLSGGTAVAGA